MEGSVTFARFAVELREYEDMVAMNQVCTGDARAQASPISSDYSAVSLSFCL